MHYWRLALLAVLIAVPTLFLVGLGSYFLWERGWGLWAWLPMTASMVLASVLAWHWQRQQRLLRVDFNTPFHWTERDRQAWHLVELRAQAAGKLTPDTLTELNFYVETAKEMALELARFYHPGSKDPI